MIKKVLKYLIIVPTIAIILHDLFMAVAAIIVMVQYLFYGCGRGGCPWGSRETMGWAWDSPINYAIASIGYSTIFTVAALVGIYYILNKRYYLAACVATSVPLIMFILGLIYGL